MKDKEKQIEICENCKIADNCSHRILIHMEKCKVNDCDCFQNISIDKEMIEEMADIIFNSRYKNDYISPLKGANELYNAGYRKIDKDSVVLSREELEKIINQTKETEKNYYKKVVIPQERKETVEKFMVLRGYITKQFHHYHEVRNIAEEKYKKCKEEMGKAVLNNDWHRADAIMFILEDIATQFDELAKQFGVEIKE